MKLRRLITAGAMLVGGLVAVGGATAISAATSPGIAHADTCAQHVTILDETNSKYLRATDGGSSALIQAGASSPGTLSKWELCTGSSSEGVPNYCIMNEGRRVQTPYIADNHSADSGTPLPLSFNNTCDDNDQFFEIHCVGDIDHDANVYEYNGSDISWDIEWETQSDGTNGEVVYAISTGVLTNYVFSGFCGA